MYIGGMLWSVLGYEFCWGLCALQQCCFFSPQKKVCMCLIDLSFVCIRSDKFFLNSSAGFVANFEALFVWDHIDTKFSSWPGFKSSKGQLSLGTQEIRQCSCKWAKCKPAWSSWQQDHDFAILGIIWIREAVCESGWDSRMLPLWSGTVPLSGSSKVLVTCRQHTSMKCSH